MGYYKPHFFYQTQGQLVACRILQLTLRCDNHVGFVRLVLFILCVCVRVRVCVAEMTLYMEKAVMK